MGVDIYAYAELNKNGIWELAQETHKVDETVLGMKTGKSWFEPEDLNFGRNYNFFGFLVDVNNHNEIPSLSKPRGIPDDVNSIILEQSKRQVSFSRSHSWVMAGEIFDFDYNTKFVRHGYVDEKLVTLFKDGKSKFPKDNWKEEYKLFNTVFYESFIQGVNKKLVHSLRKVTWVETYKELIGEVYLNEVFDKLKKLGNPKITRIVFWFG